MLLWGHHHFLQENDPMYVGINKCSLLLQTEAGVFLQHFFYRLRLGSSLSTFLDAYTLDVSPILQLKDR